MLFNRRDGVWSVTAFADNFSGRLAGKQRAHSLAGEGFVVDD
jgi:hypothetical protein